MMLASLLFLSACKGDLGPGGPQGTQGPQGAQGPAGPNVSRDRLPCRQPDGGFTIATPMVDIGLTCIETVVDFANQTYFLRADYLCQQNGLRLCTYAEWYTACSQFGDKVNKMTDDWEWVNAVYPDDGGVKALLVGNGSCDAAMLQRVGEQNSFRCCQ